MYLSTKWAIGCRYVDDSNFPLVRCIKMLLYNSFVKSINKFLFPSKPYS